MPPTDLQPDDRFLTVREVANHFRVSTDTVRKWVRNRIVTSIDISSGKLPNYRILESSLTSVGKSKVSKLTNPLLADVEEII